MHRQIVPAMLLLTACTTSLGAESLAPALHQISTPYPAGDDISQSEMFVSSAEDLRDLLGSGYEGTLEGVDPALIQGLMAPAPAAGSVLASRVAAWDGNTWHALGEGVDATVYALAIYRGELVAGGWFTHAGGLEAAHIAAWDGEAWEGLGRGQGLDGEVRAMAVFDGMLVAGGSFMQAGSAEARFLAAWDGTEWHDLGADLNGEVEAIAVYDGELVIGGTFSLAGGDSVNCVAAWDGHQWHPMGYGMGGC